MLTPSAVTTLRNIAAVETFAMYLNGSRNHGTGGFFLKAVPALIKGGLVSKVPGGWMVTAKGRAALANIATVEAVKAAPDAKAKWAALKAR